MNWDYIIVNHYFGNRNIYSIYILINIIHSSVYLHKITEDYGAVHIKKIIMKDMDIMSILLVY